MTTVRCPNCDATYNVDPAKLAGGGRKLKCASCQTVWLAVAEVAEAVPEPVAEVVVETPAAEPVDAIEGGDDTVEAPDVPAEQVEDVGGDAAFSPDNEEMIVQRTPGVDAVMRVGGWWQWIRGDNVWRTAAVGVVVLGLLCGALVTVMKMGGGEEDVAKEPAASVEGHVDPKVALPADMVQPPKGIVLHRVRGEVNEVDGKNGGMALTVRGLLANTTSQTMTVPPMRLELLGKDGSIADMWPVSGVAARMEPGAEESWSVSLTAPDMTAIEGWRVVFVSE